MNFTSAASRRTEQGLSHAARLIGCELEVLQTIILVETGGTGFDKERRPKALFEPHIFYKLLRSQNDKTALARAERLGLAYAKWGARPYPADSYPRINAACAINEELALQATSWGLPQILGLNHAPAGYKTAGKMLEAFLSGEDEQLAAMARFIKAKGLDRALQRKDWAAFAMGYNGPAYKKHGYHVKLAKTYARLLNGSARLEPITPDSLNHVAASKAKAAGGAMAAGAIMLAAVDGARAVTMPTGAIWADLMIGAALLAGAGALGWMAVRQFNRVEAFKDAEKL